MTLAEVLIERSANALNRPFTYLYPSKDKLNTGVRVVVSFANRDVVGYVVNVKEDERTKEEYEKDSGFVLNEIKSVLDKSPILNDEMLNLAKEVSDYYLSPLISVLQTMLPPSLKPRFSTLKAPKVHYEKYLAIVDESEKDLTPKQVELLRLIYKNGKVKKRDLKSPSVIKKLIELNRIREIDIEVPRLKIPEFEKEEKKTLTPAQKNALTTILNSKNKISLIEGVTGSGKTEVYLALSEEVIKKGRNVLMLVPEISLTSVMVRYYIRRFKGKVAILHSELTPAEKYDEYRRIARGEANIVVGARSAIFAPPKNIGLIILDGEHVESYKQDNVPTYHAREIAFMRAKTNNSMVVLGSATPLLETRIRAMKGIYNHVVLPERINKQPLPKTTIVDMLKGYNLCRDSHMFSKILYDKIKDRLEKKEQIILLINRRGFSTSVVCRECGQSIKCPTCGISLTYHRDDNMLKCHHCGHVMQYPKTCPNCDSKYLSRTGFGTERIEEEIIKLFPKARVLRLDSDVGRVRNNISRVIEKFRNQEADILIGTQMIAKGHDFPNVTLVGVVLADIGLSLPSFRNTEKAFTLITQAIGRSGRDKKAGEAIIQTYMPEHYAIQLASRQDYNAFFNTEMKIRKASQYPPYTYLISLTIKAKKEDLAQDIAYQIASDLTNKNYQDVKILGPSTPYIPYENEWHVREILIKYKKEDEIRKYIEKLRITLQNKPSVSIIVNVDPFDF
ncbi:MAG: primosomal protein N' [Bacilli bacterium]|nr:primosomal protein N' [Bacilli bacterium]